MSSKRLTISIGGREALPIRAIPYVSLWEFSPDLAARELAHCEAAPFTKLRGLTAYHLSDGVPVAVLAREWEAVIAALAGLEATLKEKHANDHIGYAAWRKASTGEIPAGVFVWLDDFTQALDRSGCEYTLTPMLDEATRVMVFEGFETFAPSAPAAEQSEPTTAKASEPAMQRSGDMHDEAVVVIGGREAVPVRAIPFVTGYQWLPKVLAIGLAHGGDDDDWGLPEIKLSSYHRRPNGSYTKILPKEWVGVISELDGLVEKLRNENAHKSVWMRESLPLLPATAFVWKDELEAGYRKLNCPYRKEIMWEQEGDRELTFSPMMTTEQRAIVLEGFPADEAQEAAAPAMSGAKADTDDCRLTDEEEARLEAHFDSGFSEPVSISWEYWIARFPSLTAKAASRLMVGLEPHKFEDLTPYYQAQDSIAARADRARKIEELAVFEGMTEATARDWLEWARHRKFNLHPMFAVAVDEWQTSQPERDTPACPSETAAAPLEKAREADKASTGHDWKEAARAIASEYLTKHKAMDLHPSLNDASEHVAREMRTAKIYGPQGKPLSHGTIKREALQGDWWKRNG